MVSWFGYFNLLYILLYDRYLITKAEMKSIEHFSNLCFHENKLTSLYQTYLTLKNFHFHRKGNNIFLDIEK